MAAGGQIQARNLNENINNMNHPESDGEVDSDEDMLEEEHLPRRRHIAGANVAGEIGQAAAVADVVGESLRLRSRQWDKYVDMLLRLPFLFLLDQILLQDMGWNGINNLTNSNYSSQVFMEPEVKPDV